MYGVTNNFLTTNSKSKNKIWFLDILLILHLVKWSADSYNAKSKMGKDSRFIVNNISAHYRTLFLLPNIVQTDTRQWIWSVY